MSTDTTGPSLIDRARVAARRAERVPWPSGYGAALAVLAAIPLVSASLACGLAWHDMSRDRAQTGRDATRTIAFATARRNAAARVAMTPYLAVPTLTAALAGIAAALPPDASLHAIERTGGVIRIEVDCPDPDTLLRAVRAHSPGLAWRSIAQSVTAGAGVRVTLEAAGR